MNILRKILVGIACGLLPFVLFGFGLSFSIHRVFGTSDATKNALSESGIYDAAAENFLVMAQKDDKSNQGTAGEISALPVNDPGVTAAVEKSFPAKAIQPQVEKALDDTYAWIHGDTKELAVAIDLNQNRMDLLGNLTSYASERAAALPPCPAGTAITPDFDAFKAACLPSGVTPAMAASAARKQLLESDFFKEKSLDINIAKQGNEKSLTFGSYSLPNAQEAYQASIKGIYTMGIIAVIFIVMTIFLSQSIRAGIRRAAKISLSVGVATTILALLSTLATGRFANALAESAGETASFQSGVSGTIHLLASDLRAWWLGYGILLIVLSIGAFIGLKVLSEKDTIERNNATPEDERPHIVTNN